MALQKIHASPLALAVGSSLESQVRGVTAMVRSLSEGIGPETKDVRTFGEFYTHCVYKLASFFTYESVDVLASGAAGKPRLLYGRKALVSFLHFVEDSFAKKIAVTLPQLQPFRTYAWLLTKDEDEKARAWFTQVLSAHALGKKQITNEADSEVCTVLAKSGASASASSSAIVPTSFSTAITKSKKSTPAEQRKTAKATLVKADIMKFFVGKGKT